MHLPFEKFPALTSIGTCRHVFTQRIPAIDVADEKPRVLERLESAHHEIRKTMGLGDSDEIASTRRSRCWPLFTAEQVHGNKIAVVEHPVASAVLSGVDGREFSGCDGIITNQRGIALGIYVADCCAVYIVDPKTPAIGLVHSGRKGTELGVVTNAIEQMIDRFGSEPSNMIVQLSPCIRPPHYEVDFAAEIIRQSRALGVGEIHDPGTCTACDLQRYYSYRAEKGKTGRMLAMLGLESTDFRLDEEMFAFYYELSSNHS